MNMFIALTEIGKYQTMLIILSGICLMGAHVEMLNISFVLSYAKCDLKLTIAEQGILSSISILGTVLTSYFWGFLTDVWGRQRVVCCCALGAFLFSFPSGFASNFYAIIVLRFVGGAM